VSPAGDLCVPPQYEPAGLTPHSVHHPSAAHPPRQPNLSASPTPAPCWFICQVFLIF